MTRKILVRVIGLVITAYLAVPSLASAQQFEYRLVTAKKWEYQDLTKIIEVKSPYPETKPLETKAETKPSDMKAEAKPSGMRAETGPAETRNKDQLPTID